MRDLLVLVTAFAALPALAEPVTVTDGNGREITLPAPPERIVCLLNRCAQELAFIGGPVPVGFGAPYTYNVAIDPINFGEAAASAAQVDQTDGVDFEEVAALSPDLVIGEAEMAPASEGIAPLYSLNWDPQLSVDAFLADVRNYAALLGRTDETEAKIAAVLDRVAAYAALSPNDRSVAIISVEADGASMWLPPDCGLFLSQSTPCARDENGDWIQGGAEVLLSYDPDVLIVEDYGVGDDAALAAFSAQPLWAELSAVKAGEVHMVAVSAARANTIQSVAAMMDTVLPLLYPDTFPAPLTDEQVAAALAE